MHVDTGRWALMVLATLHGVACDEKKLDHEYGSELFQANTIIHAAQSLGFSGKRVKQDLRRLNRAPLPAIGKWKDGSFFLLAQYRDAVQSGGVLPADSVSTEAMLSDEHSALHNDEYANVLTGEVLIQEASGDVRVVSVKELVSQWTGELIFLTSKASYAGAMAKFDFSWFIPAIIKYRKLLGEVLLLSFALQIIGLSTPMFFQVVMDKVLVNHAFKTLNVIAVGLICATVFDVLLTGIRTWVFSHTTSKIDVELGARLFRHLMRLPLPYFHVRRVGDSVARVRELENIRNFLTGNAMTLALDLLFSFVFLAIMFWYSLELTLIVLASIPLYVLLSLIFTPVIRDRLDTKFNKGAENQSFLVESISGIDTLKSLAVEPRWTKTWDKQLAAYVTAGLAVNKIGVITSGGVNLISKLVTVGIMWLGATLVIDNKMTVGELVAFNMLSGQVSGPILRLAQLWNDFQQVGISMSRLGDILNTHTEVVGEKTRLPRLEGAITLDQVSFRYRPDASDALRGVSMHVEPGQIIGIVGRSGSGKSTLTKLVQRLYIPTLGRVLIDGHDISIIDTTSLRQQVGVVLQENVLFNRSVRDNIAVIDPTLSIEAIIDAAKLAGAHEFICELTEGYDTIIGEHGTGLSGGQRQRVAIARALISNPRILIFDEATSALDYESERIIQDNMRRICAGRTVLIIAHRLSAVRDADCIFVMDKGQIVEQGSHAALLKNANGIYTHLYQLQQGVGGML